MIYIIKSVGDKGMNEELSKEIAERIRMLRKSKNISQEKIAEICDVGRSKVSYWENASRNISVKDAVKIVRELNTSLNYLSGYNSISEEEYIRISEAFFRSKELTIDEKMIIIRILEDGMARDNYMEIYEKYKISQKETK